MNGDGELPGGVVTDRQHPDPAWEERAAALWATFDQYTDEAAFRARVDELAAELPAGHPVAAFERAGARDATDQGAEAVELYREALAGGLDGIRRRRAVIQLSSTLRALGDPGPGLEMLSAERAGDSDELDDAVTGFLALMLIDSGREREAASIALVALARHLPRYNRALAFYARAVLDGDEPPAG